jgi:hypothetical protein
MAGLPNLEPHMKPVSASSAANGLASILLSILAGVAWLPAAQADEGMWTFDNFPRADVRKTLGADLTPQWLDRVRRSTVRIEGGCTGSFASPNGLVLTNHHCVTECLRQLSSPGKDVEATGMLATTIKEEPRCEAERISVLTRIEDVSAQVKAAIADQTGAESNKRRKQQLTALEKACEDGYKAKKDPHSCEAVTLYNGGQYFLYHYKRYDDVRLVFAPEYDLAFFGGDPDNFEFPRWDLDMSMLRAYENGKPARTPDYLNWRRSGAAAGEPVFVAGHPGSTNRLITVAELQFQREVALPRWLLRAAELRGRYLQFAAQSPENARIVNERLFGLENSLKARRYQFDALLDENLMTRKRRDEDNLRTDVARTPKLAQTAVAWDDIAKALADYRAYYNRLTFVERGSGFQGELMNYARELVRAGIERDKPNGERLREYTDSALPQIKQEILASNPIYPELEQLRLGFSFEKLVEALGPDSPVVAKVLGRDSPQQVAARLIRGTRLADPQVRKALWDGGRAAIEKSTDPMIQLALRVEPDARELRKRYDDRTEAALASAGERIAAARFALQGTNTYPDATFTLRLTYGTVRGWREGDEDVAPFTDLAGLYRRATGAPPFRLPEIWLAKQSKLALDTRFNFSSNADIIGGNSGSPVLDEKGRLVGLIFDGNIHSLGGDYWFDPALNRATAVHPAAMLLALEKVYGARALLRELKVEK